MQTYTTSENRGSIEESSSISTMEISILERVSSLNQLNYDPASPELDHYSKISPHEQNTKNTTELLPTDFLLSKVTIDLLMDIGFEFNNSSSYTEDEKQTTKLNDSAKKILFILNYLKSSDNYDGLQLILAKIYQQFGKIPYDPNDAKNYAKVLKAIILNLEIPTDKQVFYILPLIEEYINKTSELDAINRDETFIQIFLKELLYRADNPYVQDSMHPLFDQVMMAGFFLFKDIIKEKVNQNKQETGDENSFLFDLKNLLIPLNNPHLFPLLSIAENFAAQNATNAHMLSNFVGKQVMKVADSLIDNPVQNLREDLFYFHFIIASLKYKSLVIIPADMNDHEFNQTYGAQGYYRWMKKYACTLDLIKYVQFFNLRIIFEKIYETYLNLKEKEFDRFYLEQVLTKNTKEFTYANYLKFVEENKLIIDSIQYIEKNLNILKKGNIYEKLAFLLQARDFLDKLLTEHKMKRSSNDSIFNVLESYSTALISKKDENVNNFFTRLEKMLETNHRYQDWYQRFKALKSSTHQEITTFINDFIAELNNQNKNLNTQIAQVIFLQNEIGNMLLSKENYLFLWLFLKNENMQYIQRLVHSIFVTPFLSILDPDKEGIEAKLSLTEKEKTEMKIDLTENNQAMSLTLMLSKIAHSLLKGNGIINKNVKMSLKKQIMAYQDEINTGAFFEGATDNNQNNIQGVKADTPKKNKKSSVGILNPDRKAYHQTTTQLAIILPQLPKWPKHIPTFEQLAEHDVKFPKAKSVENNSRENIDYELSFANQFVDFKNKYNSRTPQRQHSNVNLFFADKSSAKGSESTSKNTKGCSIL